MISKSKSKRKGNKIFMYDLLGIYKGINVYMISRDDFFNVLDEVLRTTKKNMWMIIDDNMLIHCGNVIGQINKERNSVQLFTPAASYKLIYGKYIREHAGDKPKVHQCLSERVTVEKLYKEGEKRLFNFAREAEDRYFNCGNIGAEKLAAIYQDGLTLVGKYKEAREV